jgi:hypothetical protein
MPASTSPRMLENQSCRMVVIEGTTAPNLSFHVFTVACTYPIRFEFPPHPGRTLGGKEKRLQGTKKDLGAMPRSRSVRW